MFNVIRHTSVVSKATHILLNQHGKESVIQTNERITCLEITDALSGRRFAVRKKSGDILFLPMTLFKSFKVFCNTI